MCAYFDRRGQRMAGYGKRNNKRGRRDDQLTASVQTSADEPTPKAKKEEALEYGYTQIRNYNYSKKRSCRQWIDLPKNSVVITFPGKQPIIEMDEMERATVGPQVLRRSKTQSGETRLLRFADGAVPGTESSDQEANDGRLAEWIYVDRDICGISLYAYDPQNATTKRAYVSSEYGQDFIKEYSCLEATCSQHFEEVMSCLEEKAVHDEEDKQLDLALELAGVARDVLS